MRRLLLRPWEGKDIDQKDARNKAVNTLVSLVQGLAETRGRNQKLYGDMVKKSSSYKASKALANNLIDGIANTQAQLIKKIHGRKVSVKGKTYKMILDAPEIVPFEMDLGQKLLNIFGHPNVAYLLLLAGIALLYLELKAPGGFLAGSLGVIFLILAGIGFQVLPLNFGALCLILLSVILFLLESFIVSYGILSIFALSSLVFGSLFLYRTDDAYLELSLSLIITVISAISLFIFFILIFIVKDRRKKTVATFNSLNGKKVKVVNVLGNGFYMVKVSGELWKAQSETILKEGDSAIVCDEDRDQMILKL